jgi:hypothetical protein
LIVTTRLVALYETTAANGVTEPVRTIVAVAVVKEAGFMLSEKVAVGLTERATPVAPLPGVEADTVGGAVSGVVVNVPLPEVARLPAASRLKTR